MIEIGRRTLKRIWPINLLSFAYRAEDFFASGVILSDVTGVFCTSGSEREFTLEGSWYADEEIQAGADRDPAAAD